ncbi:outer membrane lipoprotein carrier protein LolA [Sphingomonas endophytica]|jgi:outer membrane lipoprotein-sorting protein|uniref:Outer membrane lipoprotein-sorting protein n=1 Tax=Sphingomonas endophytica TaxID=869719 RepID=A0ABR6N8R6_9SPHN|nr:outer membrane lipoprotein carrier protein LolA [Sphingomonas endophytica]MBB5726446.1 outer membrane lipoprotein-sorting protein [Sphingomonas endophytica]
MSQYLLPLAALVAVASPVAAQTGTDLAAVQRAIAGIDSMTAAFSQTDRNGQVLTGTLTLKKPGKIRFQYQKGVPLLIVGDGKALTFIDYSVKQVQRWPIGSSPLGVLLDPGRDISRYAKIVPSSNPAVLSVEAYDPKHPEYGRITLVFARSAAAPGGLMLQGWAALDTQGNRTTIRLSDQKFNVPVADSAFRWTDPRRQGRSS